VAAYPQPRYPSNLRPRHSTTTLRENLLALAPYHPQSFILVVGSSLRAYVSFTVETFNVGNLKPQNLLTALPHIAK